MQLGRGKRERFEGSRRWNVTVVVGLFAWMSVVIAATEGDKHDSLLSGLAAATVGTAFGLAMVVRRRRARQSGRYLEQHAMWRQIWLFYGTWWILVLGMAIALLRVDAPRAGEVLLFVVLLGVVVLTGALIRVERRQEAAVRR